MLKPAALAAALASTLALGACKQAPAPTADTAKAAPATPAYTLDEAKLPPVIRFTPADLDAAGNACKDFGAYVNGKWLAANDIPADRSSWGAFDMLAERSLAVRHQLAEQAASNEGATGVDKIVGDFYATGMDQAKVDAQGLAPMQDELDAIGAIADQAALAEYLRTSAAKGRNSLFGFGPEADFKNSSMNIAYATQGGLGLPDRGYYFDADKKDKLEAYRKHVAKVLELSGTDAASAAKQADAVVAFETRLAKASKSSEELSRDVSLYYNPVSPADADKLTPNFPWTKFFESQGIAVPQVFSLAMPAFHKEVNAMLADVPVDDWKAYLRFHAVDEASPYLAEPFAQENYEFYAKAMRGQKEQRARWKRVLGAIEANAGEAFGQIYVKTAFPAESKARMEQLVQNLRTALKGRIEKLDWMSDETKAKAIAKWESFTPKIGYPDKWRDWSGLQTSRDSYIGNVLAANEFN
jgi:putative endopeptidase